MQTETLTEYATEFYVKIGDDGDWVPLPGIAEATEILNDDDKTKGKYMEDNVKHPKHYDLPGLPVEAIDVVRSVLGPEGFMKFCRGCALKYLIRADKKGGAEDLQKAMVYINWELSGLHAEAPETEEEADERGK